MMPATPTLEQAQTPLWQIDAKRKGNELYPVTFETDPERVRAVIREMEGKLEIERRTLARVTRLHAEHGTYRRVIEGHRRVIDRLERYARNARQRHREIIADLALKSQENRVVPFVKLFDGVSARVAMVGVGG